jgi:hypothetical protein
MLKRWKIHQMDVSGAFLLCRSWRKRSTADLHQGLRIPEGRVWKLKKSLYGLKQAPREWIATLGTTLKKGGFHPVKSEPSLWILEKDGGTVYLLVFVDDILLGSTREDLLDYAKRS